MVLRRFSLQEQRKALVLLNKKNICIVKRNISTKVFGWGSNDAGELGTNLEAHDQLAPLPVELADKVDLASCGYGTTFLSRKFSSVLHRFGLNSAGQLGIDEQKNERANFDGHFIEFASGRAHSLALTTEAVYVTGSNIQGQCGLSHNVKFSKSFQKIRLPFEASRIKQICCGLDNSLILTKDGKIFSTGLGADGQTGLGQYDCQYGFENVLGDINNEYIIQVSSTTDTCLALTDEGSLFGWGNNEQGQISRRNKEKQIAVPMRILDSSTFPRVSRVLSGGSFSAIISDGTVYVQGYGALGIGSDDIEVDDFSAVKVDQTFGKVVEIKGSADFVAALTERGQLLTWGRGNHGRLGHGNTDDLYFPKEVTLPGKVLQFACGNDHMIAIVEDNG